MRLFVAAEVPERHKRSIEKAVQSLRLDLGPAFRWVPRENWHATVTFLGEVPDERLPEVSAIVGTATAAAPATTSSLTDVGAFASLNRARVLWVGLDDPGGRLAAVAGALDASLGDAGFRQESRPLRPHVTLARAAGKGRPVPIAAAVDASGPYDLDREPFEVGRLVLFRSLLSRTGVTYRPLREFPLGTG